MGLPLVFAWLLVAGVSNAGAFVSLTVKTVRADRKESKSWQTSWGSYHKRVRRSRSLDIRVRNMSQDDINGQLCIYYFGKAFTGGRRAYPLLHTTTKPLLLETKKTVHVLEKSPPFTRNVQNYAALRERYAQGRIADGWLVCVRGEDGEVLKAKGSTVPVEQLIKNGKLAKMLEKQN